MGYVLRNGKRYYQDENGNLSLDNVSQEEADRRERRNANSVFTATNTYSGTSRNSTSSGMTGTMPGHKSVPWMGIILMAVILVLIGAFFYNQRQASSAEKAITDYMENVSGSGDSHYESDEAESLTEHERTEMTEVSQSYLLPDSAERYLTASEIVNYSHDEIQLMPNEIYARHGREFHSQNNVDYFSGLNWYNPVPGKTDEEIVREFNTYEKANVDLLSEHL